MQSLDSISLDTSGLHLESEGDGVRAWHTEFGDRVGLHYFSLPPDIGADLGSVDGVREFYRQACGNAGGAIIEVHTPIIDDCPATRTIIKVPQQPTGMAYVGSITLPYRDFSFVVRIECPEHGTTGIREAVILDRLMASGQVEIDDNGRMAGWMADPYDRLRPILRRMEGTLRVAADVKAEPRFVFERIRKPRRWWSSCLAEPVLQSTTVISITQLACQFSLDPLPPVVPANRSGGGNQ